MSPVVIVSIVIAVWLTIAVLCVMAIVRDEMGHWG